MCGTIFSAAFYSSKLGGEIGAHGRLVAEPFDSEALAAKALQLQADRKRKRGYRDVP